MKNLNLNYIATLLLIFFFSNLGSSQSSYIKPLKLDKSSNKKSFSQYELKVKDATFFSLDKDQFNDLKRQKSKSLSLEIPQKTGSIVIDIEEVNIFEDNFKVTTVSQGEEKDVAYKKGKHYIGKIVNDKESLVAFSLFDDELNVVISNKSGSLNIEKIGGADDKYISYYDHNISYKPTFRCETDDAAFEIPKPDLAKGVSVKAGNSQMISVSIFIECDFKMYQDNGSDLTATSNFATGLFNVVAGIYSSSSVTITISQIMVHTSTDPYNVANQTNSGTVLDLFECERTSYNGRMAHLLSTASVGLGGIAQRPSHNDPNCTTGDYTSRIYGFSNIHNSYNTNLNVFSWSVEVFAHELGHNFSSPHTHSCEWSPWNGGSTQIDDCGNVAQGGGGACYNPSSPILPSAGNGTIMSYCHLPPNQGINLALGFHSQVELQIQDFANDCISASYTAPACNNLTSTDISMSNIMPTSADFTISPGTGATFYWWAHKLASASNYTYTSVGSSSTTISLTGLTTGASYNAIFFQYCSGWTEWCGVPFTFTAGNSGSNCPNNYSGVNKLTGTVSTTMNYETDGVIQSEQNISANVDYNSGSFIELLQGFQVTVGNVFNVILDGCSNLLSGEESKKSTK